ncbi:MAG TPA: type II toxin-antitoxin system RelE/ParE family toxin [Longimicrobiaceae bacterium]|jgi:phage-related protein|nr:type II toxin-antitoxin system RelE/ParE family toxin [Longimicrobiaceae bacterium]
MGAGEKRLEWMGASLADVTAFPGAARQEAGYQLGRVQLGGMPTDFKPMPDVGSGTYEIRIRVDEGGTVQYRVLFVAKFEEAIYVLHAFQKTTETTSKRHKEVAAARYGEVLQLRRELAQRKGSR